jgi:hypothetical protein
MYSLGDMIDKLVIENIKIFSIREKLHGVDVSDEEYVTLNNKMMILNENRGTIASLLDQKVEDVVSGKVPNRILKTVKTYGIKK